jgi:quercetin dioxygenase-like cupin family protein
MSVDRYHAGKVSAVEAETPVAFQGGHSEGYTVRSLVDYRHGSAHTMLSVHELAPGGRIEPHFHSTEEGIFVLEGDVLLAIDGVSHALGQHDYALSLAARRHALRNVSVAPVRWLEMRAPLPVGPDRERDVYFESGPTPESGASIDARDPRSRFVGHFDEATLSPIGLGGPLTRDGKAPLEGPSFRELVGRPLGAQHVRMFIIQFNPGGGIALHDHPLEESYFVLHGEVEVVLGEEMFAFQPGDFGWAGVATPHSFLNTGSGTVRWLETQSPQPTPQGSNRLLATWKTLREELGDG